LKTEKEKYILEKPNIISFYAYLGELQSKGKGISLDKHLGTITITKWPLALL